MASQDKVPTIKEYLEELASSAWVTRTEGGEWEFIEWEDVGFETHPDNEKPIAALRLRINGSDAVYDFVLRRWRDVG